MKNGNAETEKMCILMQLKRYAYKQCVNIHERVNFGINMGAHMHVRMSVNKCKRICVYKLNGTIYVKGDVGIQILNLISWNWGC